MPLYVVLKDKVVDKDMLKAFTSSGQIPRYPFELTDNPNTESIQDISRTIDAFCAIY